MDNAMLALLANPNHPDHPPLRLEGDLLICTLTGVGFKVENGIPQLLPEQEIPADKVQELLKNGN